MAETLVRLRNSKLSVLRSVISVLGHTFQKLQAFSNQYLKSTGTAPERHRRAVWPVSFLKVEHGKASRKEGWLF